MNDNRDSVTFYLQSIAKTPLLTRARELEHGHKMVDGRKEIAVLILKSSKALKALGAIVVDRMEEDDEEDAALLGLLSNLTPDNRKLLHEYLIHLDYDILVKLGEVLPKVLLLLKNVQTSRDVLITSNLRLVVAVAKQYTNAGLSFMDLIEEGNLGLLRAVDKFDPTRESKLCTLATWWIRQAVIRSLSNKSRTIRVPVHMVDALNRAYKKLTVNIDKPPKPEDMLRELNMPNLTLAEVKEMMDVMVGPVPIHAMVDSEGTTTYEAFLRDTGEAVDKIVSNAEFKDKFLRLVSKLSPREEKIVRLKAGI